MKTRIKSLLAATFALSLGGAAYAATCPGPDTFGHTCENDGAGCGQVAGIDNDVTGGALNDDGCTARSIGFSFMFYGNAYTDVGVASNGFVQLGGCGGGSGDFTNDCPIPTAATANEAVYGVWDDLNPGGAVGSIQDGLVGAAPDRTYVVEYNAVPFFGGGGATTFQVQLHENGGDGESATVWIQDSTQTDYTSGLENASGTDGLTRWCDNGPTGTSCTLYSAAGGGGGGGGDCDLTEVLDALADLEAKLDTDVPARFDDLDAGQAQILTEIGAVADAISGIDFSVLDSVGDNLCEIIRLLHTPQGRRTSSTSCGDFEWSGAPGAGE